MERIPPLGWIALALILIITIGVNVNMFSMLRDRNNKKNPRKMKIQRPNATGQQPAKSSGYHPRSPGR